MQIKTLRPAMKIRGKVKPFVYQATSIQFANASTPGDPRRQKRRLVVKTQPGTPAQTARWDIVREAARIWKAYPKDRKKEERARAKRLRAENGFIVLVTEMLREK